MEPFSFFGVVALSMAAGAIISIVFKKPNASNRPTIKDSVPEQENKKQEVMRGNSEEVSQGIIDAEKEKAIDDLISHKYYERTEKRGER